MKFQIVFTFLESEFPSVPIIIDEEDITPTTDWSGIMNLALERLKEMAGPSKNI